MQVVCYAHVSRAGCAPRVQVVCYAHLRRAGNADVMQPGMCRMLTQVTGGLTVKVGSGWLALAWALGD